MGYDAGRLTLRSQAMAGPKEWTYYDTGGEAVSVYEGAGYFTDAKQRGVDTGDRIEVWNNSSKVVYSGRFTTVQDTGSTTGTVTLDTGPDIPG
jgi:hypothetical protein